VTLPLLFRWLLIGGESRTREPSSPSPIRCHFTRERATGLFKILPPGTMIQTSARQTSMPLMAENDVLLRDVGGAKSRSPAGYTSRSGGTRSSPLRFSFRSIQNVIAPTICSEYPSMVEDAWNSL